MKTKTRILSLVLCLAMVIGYFTFGVSAAETTATLVTDVSTLAAGDRIVITNKDGTYALSTTQKTNNRSAVAISGSNGSFTVGSEVQILTLVEGTAANSWAFSPEDGKYLYASSTSANQLKTTSTLDNKASFNITITNGTASITCVNTSQRGVMQYNYNNGSPLFACYSSASQTQLAIYKIVVTTEDPEPCTHANVTVQYDNTNHWEYCNDCKKTVDGTTETHSIDPNGDCTGCDHHVDPSEPEEPATSGLTVGDKIVFAFTNDKDETFAMGTQNSKGYRDKVDITITDGVLDLSTDAVVFEVEVGNADNSFAFKGVDGYLSYTGSGNNLYTSSTKNDASSWTVVLQEDRYVITNVDNTERLLQYNASSPRFACYKSTSNQLNPTIYKISESTDTSEPVVGTEMSAYLSLESEVFLNVNFTLENVGDVDPATLASKVGLLVWDASATPAEADAIIDSGCTVLTNAVWNADRGRYVVKTEGIPAKKMGDLISFRPYYITENGTYVYGRIISNYSPKTYCYNMLDPAQDTKTDNDALMVAILNYGAAAQQYFEYRTDDLMNADLLPEQKTTSWNGSLVRTDWEVPADKEGKLTRNEDVVTGRGGFLSLEGAIDYNFYIRVSESVNVASVKLLSWNEDTYNNLTTLTDNGLASAPDMVWNATENRYEYKFEGRAAKTMFSPIYACAVVTDTDGNVYYGGVLAYSPERFAYVHADEGNALAELAKCLVIYGDAARNFFN